MGICVSEWVYVCRLFMETEALLQSTHLFILTYCICYVFSPARITVGIVSHYICVLIIHSPCAKRFNVRGIAYFPACFKELSLQLQCSELSPAVGELEKGLTNSQKEDQGPQDCLLTKTEVGRRTGFERKALTSSGKRLYTNLGKFQSVGGLKFGGM